MHDPSTRPRAAPAYTLGLCAMLVLGAAAHLSQIDAPFGFGEGNAGSYFACVAKGYYDFGFAALRGAPFVPDIYGGLSPYLHHPPLGFWLVAMFGAQEWQMRTTTLIAHLVSALVLVQLVRPLLGDVRALLAGTMLLLLPTFYLDIQASQWPFTIACGLLLLLGFDRQRRSSSWRWRLLTAAAAFVGPWIDWHFGFFCLALLPLVEWRAPAIRRLVIAWTLSGASLALFLWWRHWAAHAPIWAAPGEGISNASLVSGTILLRPPFLDQLRGMLACSGTALTVPVLIGMVVGLPWLIARAPRHAAALLVAGLLGSLLFGNHVLTHTDFPSMLGPFAVTAAAAMFARHRLGIVLIAVVLGVGGWSSLQRVRASRTTFFRAYGHAATAATREVLADGSERHYIVASDMSWAYRYYIDSFDFLIQPLADPALVENNRAALKKRGKGVRFLTLRYGGAVGARWNRYPELEKYLAQFPAERLPELEMSFTVDGAHDALRIEQALLVTIEP